MTVTLLEDDLRDFIYDAWALTDTGLVKDTNVKFALTDANEAAPLTYAQVIVQLYSFKRHQPSDDGKYTFTFGVSVANWNNTVLKTDSAQLLHWTMVDHIKKMFDGAPSLPTNWHWAYVESGLNRGMRGEALPEQNLWDLMVTACIDWV
jgi:hypothetical protein